MLVYFGALQKQQHQNKMYQLLVHMSPRPAKLSRLQEIARCFRETQSLHPVLGQTVAQLIITFPEIAHKHANECTAGLSWVASAIKILRKEYAFFGTCASSLRSKASVSYYRAIFHELRCRSQEHSSGTCPL